MLNKSLDKYLNYCWFINIFIQNYLVRILNSIGYRMKELIIIWMIIGKF